MSDQTNGGGGGDDDDIGGMVAAVAMVVMDGGKCGHLSCMLIISHHSIPSFLPHNLSPCLIHLLFQLLLPGLDDTELQVANDSPSSNAMSSQSVSFDLGLVPVLVNREGGKVTLEKGHERVYKLEADSSSDKKSCFTIALGNGGQGAVLLAQEESSGSLVAVKQSFVRPADWEKAKREIDNLRALSGHRNIIEMVGHTAEKVRVGQPPQSLIRRRQWHPKHVPPIFPYSDERRQED